MQPRIERNVVLPEPDGPSRETTSPGETSRETPRRTSTVWRPSVNVFTTSWAERTCPFVLMAFNL
jgi:hypothetical protein